MCCSTQLVSFLLPSQRYKCSSRACLFPFLPSGGWGDRLRLARVPGRAAAVAILTCPTLGAIISTCQPTDCFASVYPGRAIFPGGDGETHCSKVRSDEVRDGTSCGAKQRQG